MWKGDNFRFCIVSNTVVVGTIKVRLGEVGGRLGVGGITGYRLRGLRLGLLTPRLA